MDFLRDLRVYAEATFPELAVLGTEILVAAALSISILVACECLLHDAIYSIRCLYKIISITSCEVTLCLLLA